MAGKRKSPEPVPDDEPFKDMLGHISKLVKQLDKEREEKIEKKEKLLELKARQLKNRELRLEEREKAVADAQEALKQTRGSGGPGCEWCCQAGPVYKGQGYEGPGYCPNYYSW